MPSAPLRADATDRLQISTRTARRGADRGRGTAHQRGYTSYWHQQFRSQFIALLVDAGIPPICGAALPGGPQTAHSRCQAEQRITGTNLHLHHEPPLTTAERQDRSRVCDPNRVVLLCRSCHNVLHSGVHGSLNGSLL